MIDLRQLQALQAVAAEGSVARAARRLGWSQPTVDYHLRNLDRLVGAELTSRSTRGSRLTAAGRLMLERGDEILSLADRALADVRELSELGRVRLRFGTFPTGAARLLPGIVHRIGEVGIDLEATLEEVAPLVTRVNQHTLDAALVYSAAGYPLPFRAEVHTTRVLTEPMLLALPDTHPLAARRSIDTEGFLSLSEESWVVGATPGDTLDALVSEVFGAVGHRLQIAIRTDDYAVMLGLVGAGLSVGIVPSLVSNGTHDGVALRPIEDPRFARELMLAAPAGPGGPSTAVRQLAEAVRRTIAALE